MVLAHARIDRWIMGDAFRGKGVTHAIPLPAHGKEEMQFAHADR
jgi:hypothetical protein